MTTLISIMAHGGAQAVFDRHLPIWKEHVKEGAELMVWSPMNDQVLASGIPQQAIVKAQHNGPDSIDRIRYILEFMAGTGHDRYGFFEYDSFCLGPIPMFKTDIAGNLFIDETPSEQFKGGMFFHPPIFLTNSGMQRLAAETKQMPSTLEGSFWDRYLGLAVKRAGLTYTSFLETGQGFSQNTVEPVQYPDLRKAILHGARCLHGIKTPDCLKVVLRAWELRMEQNDLEEEGYTVTLPD